MSNILLYCQKIIKEEVKKPTFFSVIGLAYVFCVIGFFDKALAVGLLLLLFLTITTIFITHKAGIQDRKVYVVFLIVLAVHFVAVLVIYYGHFNPFGGGADYDGYNQTAIELASRFSHGNFSLAGLYTDHFFPILMGIIYMFTLPGMIVGQLFVVWLAAVSLALVYLIVLEIGGTKKTAFLAGGIAILYPSYLFFGSVLLKDTMVIPFILLGILLILKMVKRFLWMEFLLFFALLAALINLRFYVGYALIFSCIVSWPLLSVFPLKKKMKYWLLIIFLLGLPSLLVGGGYYGFNSFKKFLNPKQITYYREVVYANHPPALPAPATPEPIIPKPTVAQPVVVQPVILKPTPSVQENSGNGSTFVLDTGFGGGMLSFVKNSSLSFIYSLLGPFPWQFRYKRQFAGLVETIPWYLLIGVFVYGTVKFIKKRGWVEFLKYYKFTLPLLVFGVLAMGALSLFINNYGIIARIRIPMLICFTCIMCLRFDDNLKNYYEKISHYWRRGIYRVSSFAKTVIPGK